jgi:hypothetical protein
VKSRTNKVERRKKNKNTTLTANEVPLSMAGDFSFFYENTLCREATWYRVLADCLNPKIALQPKV